MGVRHLFTFISKEVPSGLFEINIENEIISYRRKNNKNPTIVIDLLTIQAILKTNNHELIIGGRYNIYIEKAFDIFSKLESFGCNIIFFTDGPAQDNKIQTCLDRRNANYEDYIKLFNAIDAGLDISGIDNNNIPGPSPNFNNLIKIASEFGEVYVSTLNECDLELAHLANTHNAMAIISNDTDFLIYEGKWRFWSANITVDSMKTLEYNREALRKHLNLHSNDMPLFATISGNDIMKYDYVKDFHRQIAPSYGTKFYQIAKLVQIIQQTTPNMYDMEIKKLSSQIFGKRETDQGYQLIKSSLKSYSYSSIVKEHESEIINIVSKISGLNYVILRNQQYIITLYFFDLRKNDLMPFYDLFRPILRKIMGILLQHLNNQNASRTFYCKLSHIQPYLQTKEIPVYPTIIVPSLKMLLCTPYGVDLNLDSIRWYLLCWQISSNLSSKDIQNIPKENLINVLVLYLLIVQKQISINEADCILLASNCPKSIRDKLKLSDYTHINERDARIAFLYVRIHFFITNCFKTVGLENFCSFLTFDGLYFHSLRRDFRSSKFNSELLIKYQQIRIYDQLCHS